MSESIASALQARTADQEKEKSANQAWQFLRPWLADDDFMIALANAAKNHPDEMKRAILSLGQEV